MEKKYLVLLLVVGLAILGIIVGPTLIQETNKQAEQITEEDVAVGHSQYYSTPVFESPPDEFGTAISRHSSQLLQSDSFTFSFERRTNNTLQSSIVFEREENNSITKIRAPRPSETGEMGYISINEYFDRPTIYRQTVDQRTDETQYSRSDGISQTRAIRSGVSELQSLETSFISFEHQQTTTVSDTQYYVYSATVTDETSLDAYQIGDSSGGDTTASGQLIVSEYGVIQKATLTLERDAANEQVSFRYQLSSVGSTSVEEPLWISEFE